MSEANRLPEEEPGQEQEQDQTEMDVGGPTLSDSPSEASAELRQLLEARLPAHGALTRTSRGALLPHDVREAAARVETNKGWPRYRLELADGRTAWIKPLAATEKNAARPLRQWRLELPALDRLVLLDRLLGARGDLVLIVFDDLEALPVGEMREGHHYALTEHGKNPHALVADLGRRPLERALA